MLDCLWILCTLSFTKWIAIGDKQYHGDDNDSNDGIFTRSWWYCGDDEVVEVRDCDIDN